MGLTLNGAGNEVVTSVDHIQNMLNDPTIELPLPVYILHELARYMTYAEIRALRAVSRGYFVFVYKSIPRMLELNADNCLIGGNYISSIPLSKFTNLNHLIISNNFLDTRSFVPLTKLKFLRYLDISYNNGRIPTDGLLTELKQLRTLILSGNFLRNQHILQIQMLSNLEHLEIAEFRSLTAFPIENLSVLTSLKKLNLARNYIGARVLKSICTLPNLIDLDLSCCTISLHHHLEQLTSLTSLNLSTTVLCSDRICLSTLTRLEWLDVSYNCLDDDGLKDLAISKSVRNLNVASTGITEASLRELAKITSLTTISLHGNAISEAAQQRYSTCYDVAIKAFPPRRRHLS